MKKRILSVVVAVSLLAGALFAASPRIDRPPVLPKGVAGTYDAPGRVLRPADEPLADPVASSGQSASAAANQVPASRRTQQVAAQSPKARVRGDKAVIDNKVYPLRVYAPLYTPNDPSAAQWWVANANFTQAWDTPRGANKTLLAVIDTGFALQHEELSNRWYKNTGETGAAATENPSRLNCTARGLALDASCNLIDEDGNGIVDDEAGAVTQENPSQLNCTDQGKALDKSCNRVDDDGNGYADDVTGWDFINYDNSVQAGEVNPNGTGTTHGTETAALAAGTGNNAKGIAGVDWGTQVLPLQAIDDDSYGDTISVGRAINYSVSRGANVISLSLGSSMPDTYIRDAVRNAVSKGVVVVAASGNDGCECMVYPANYPEVVGVGALTSSNVPAPFSSWGGNLDILAPGTNMTSATWSPANGVSAYVSGINGTSFATPIVAGMMTRILSQQPAATPQQLIAAVTESTNRLSMAATPNQTNTLGFGALDAQKATVRMATAYSPYMLYGFEPSSKGNTLSVNEVTGPYAVYGCTAGTVGSTAIYELSKTGASSLFTISKVEMSKAVESGYTSSLFAYGCIQEPQDKPQVIRNVNLFQEFRNRGAKP